MTAATTRTARISLSPPRTLTLRLAGWYSRRTYGKLLEPALVFAHHPRLLERFNVLGGLFLAHGLVPARERELVILRTGWRTRCEYEFGQHTVLGRRAGLDDDEIRRVTREDARWPPGDALLIRLADEVHETHDVSDALWQELGARWSHAELLELVALAGFYGMVSALLNAARVQREPGTPGWPD